MDKPTAQLILKTTNFLTFQVGEKVAQFDKEDFIEAIDELHIWQYAQSDCFYSQLYKLIAKADKTNLFKLLNAFPQAVVAYLLWYNKPGTEPDIEFYKTVVTRLDI